MTDSSSTRLLEEFNLQRIMLKDLKEMLSDLKVNSPLTMPNLSATTTLTQYKWDSLTKHANITLSGDGLTATRVSESLTHAVVLLDINCSTGTYSWNLKFDPECTWIMTGFIESNHLPTTCELNSQTFGYRYGCAFQNNPVYTSRMSLVKAPERSGVQTFKYVMDMNAGKFEIFQGLNLIAQNSDSDFMGKVVRPFVTLYSVNNTVTIVPE